MKKIFMAVALVATLGLTSCGWFGEKKEAVPAEVVEAVAEETTEVVEAATEAVEEVKAE